MPFNTINGTAISDLIGAAGAALGPLTGLFGVIIGAALAALLARGNDTRRVVTDIRREVYFEAMDVATAMYEQLRIIGNSGPRGGTDPDADREAAGAIDALIGLMPQFVRSEARIATVGSSAVTEAAYEFRGATDNYMAAVFQHSGGQMFRVGIATLYFAQYAATLDRLARAIRADLGLAPLAVPLPVTREARDRAARLPPARWHPDPTGRFEMRWWNGAYWDDAVVAGGMQTTDDVPVRTAV